MTNIHIPDCFVLLNNILQAINDAPVECDGHTLMISSALKHAGISYQRICGVVKNPKRMQDTLANDVFVFDTLRRNAADHSYMDSEMYQPDRNRNYGHCTSGRCVYFLKALYS